MASRMTEARATSTAPRFRAASGDSVRPVGPARGAAAAWMRSTWGSMAASMAGRRKRPWQDWLEGNALEELSPESQSTSKSVPADICKNYEFRVFGPISLHAGFLKLRF